MKYSILMLIFLCIYNQNHAFAKSAVFIVGTGRSGTSCAAGALHILGVSLGDNLKEPNAHNKQGYFENKAINILNNKIAKQLPAAWWNVGRIKWETLENFQELKDQIKQCLQEEFGSYDLFGVKDPKISTLLPLYCQAAQELGYIPKIIVVLRDPKKIVDSFKARRAASGKDPDVIEPQIQYWISMCMMALLEQSYNYDIMTIYFEDLITDPHYIARKLSSFIPGLSAYEDIQDALEHFLQRDLVNQ